MEKLEELKQEAQKAFEILTELDEKTTELLNQNPTSREATRASLAIFKAVEAFREFLGV